MNRYQLGFIGCGHMGMAIAKGACRGAFLSPQQIIVYDPSEKVAQACEEQGFALADDLKYLCENSEIICLAVRPQDNDAVLEQLKGLPIRKLLSIVTGVPLAILKEKLDDPFVIRAMPNTPLQVNRGSTVICASEDCPADFLDFVRKLFSTMGLCRDIDEKDLNKMVCVHGSIPAYVYYLTDCILQDMMARGFKEEQIRDLLVETVIGSGELMKREPNKPLSAFVDEVCSKGGTTIEAISEMERQGFRQIIADADEKCIKRAEELGKK